MFGMARTLARFIMAVVIVAAYVPLPAAPVPAAPGGLGHHDGPMACCAPKDCCDTSHVCSSGVGCGGAGASGGVASAPAGIALRLFAGGCGGETPRVTPHQLDPTVAPRVVGWMPIPSTVSALFAPDWNCNSLASLPLVPPPRA
jgi:hypothetical protein